MTKLSPRSPRVTLRATQEIIDEAVVKNSGHCVWANAVKEARPEAKHISVDLQTIRWSEGGKRYTYLTPRAAQIELIKFDQGVPLEPKEVQLRAAQVTPTGRYKGSNKAVIKNPAGIAAGSVPVRVGGTTPPKAALAMVNAGQRRSFGLRSLEL